MDGGEDRMDGGEDRMDGEGMICMGERKIFQPEEILNDRGTQNNCTDH